ncbi:MAG: DUF6252 family protein [Flavobacteriaceae bacterium]
MKHIILLLFVAVIAFSSCETIEDNSTVIQAQVDSVFFKSLDAIGSETNDQGIQLQGITDNQILTLRLNDRIEREYLLSQDSENFATFENGNGVVYATTFGGEGSVTITSWETSGYVTGNFSFYAVAPGLDTIYVSKGLFYRVPYGVATNPDTPNAGTFNAQVDEAPFSPISVGAVDSGNSLLISGTTSLSSIIIRVPVDVEVGNYSLPQAGFQASYAVGATSQDATAGNISVITHNTTAKTISGSFSFVTEGNTITEGQFNVTYN